MPPCINDFEDFENFGGLWWLMILMTLMTSMTFRTFTALQSCCVLKVQFEKVKELTVCISNRSKGVLTIAVLTTSHHVICPVCVCVQNWQFFCHVIFLHHHSFFWIPFLLMNNKGELHPMKKRVAKGRLHRSVCCLDLTRHCDSTTRRDVAVAVFLLLATLRSIINKKYLLKAQSPIHVPNDAFLCIE